MSALIEFYEQRYLDWFERYTSLRWWHPFRKRRAKMEYEYYLRMMLDTAQIEKLEYEKYLDT